mmetsp:Transcript_7346/g.16833  ORF Transcript_7346/g.16833 Transcript_7346/m.16833 type:complete len:84 (+) Transcript_7346:389-640(+)
MRWFWEYSMMSAAVGTATGIVTLARLGLADTKGVREVVGDWLLNATTVPLADVKRVEITNSPFIVNDFSNERQILIIQGDDFR